MFSCYIGIALILTAEISAIRKDHKYLCSSVSEVLFPNVVHVCVDNVVILRLSQGIWTTSNDFDIVFGIHQRAQALSSRGHILYWHLAPSHEGIFDNEQADNLVKRAVINAGDTAPSRATLGQPPIQFSVCKSLVKRALENREQCRWFQVLLRHLDIEHLSRIHTSIRANTTLFAGNRATQTTLAQFCLVHSPLNDSHLSQGNRRNSHACFLFNQVLL